MKKTKAISLLLSLSLLVSLVVPCALALPAQAADGDSGMSIDKTATDNGDGTYTITLEAYATGASVITTVKKDIPTDIILVLDQSGSMKDDMYTEQEFEAYGNDRTNSYLYDRRFNNSAWNANKNLYYPLNGGYVPVQVERTGGSWFSPYVYTYYYQLEDQTRVIIETSSGASTRPTQTYYYVAKETSVSRLNALKTAVGQFESSIANQAAGADGQLGTSDDVNHRVAVVGFASRSGYGDNTELLSISGRNSGSVGVAYNNITNQNLKDVLQDMDTTSGQNMVQSGINALAAEGATRADLGLDMAERILAANPVQAGEERARVVVFFTDGSPTSSSGFEEGVANAAINKAQTIKNGGATVYSVGVFPGADATSNGIAQSNANRKENQFMQSVSSNNGTPQNPSYYLSASDSETLNSIFQQISNNIQTGGSSTTLDEQTVIKDIITPQFTLPEGASDITLETYKCTGVDGNGEYTWQKNSDAMGATVTLGSTDEEQDITTNNQISVTGFDFSDNYVGTVTQNGKVTYRGNKLVIKVKVTPREGFFGGNGVSTNVQAGVYKDADATDPIMDFPQPTVDVPLADVKVEVPDDDRYLGSYYSQSVPEDAVKMGEKITIAGCELDLSKANDPDHPYGVEPWQVEYVTISVDAETTGNGGSFENIQEDITYTVTVTVHPKNEGTDTDESATATGTGTIHVFKPYLNYKDSEVFYGDDVPGSFDGNLAEKTWKNADGSKTHTDDGVQMLNNEPTLTLTYTPDATKIADGKINTKQDVPVDATVKIGNNDVTNVTTFAHTNCAGECSWSETTPDGTPAFLLHVKTCSLTIKKTGGADGEPYVFQVLKNGNEYTEVTVVGNNSVTISELPVGDYGIEEDVGWSWRYTTGASNGVTLSKNNPNGTITCTNVKDEDQWLNHYSSVVTNTAGVPKN